LARSELRGDQLSRQPAQSPQHTHADCDRLYPARWQPARQHPAACQRWGRKIDPAQRIAQAVEDDRQEHNRQAGLQRLPDPQPLQGYQHLTPQPARTDHGCDYYHAQRHHNRLVHTGHQRRQRQGDLHLEQQLPGRRSKRLRGLDRRRIGLADAQAGQANRRWYGVD
jgi:hypothetical protein